MSGDHSSDPLRKLAAECVALAERTNDPNTRAELLMIAQKWITMANGRHAVTEPSDETPLAPKQAASRKWRAAVPLPHTCTSKDTRGRDAT